MNTISIGIAVSINDKVYGVFPNIAWPTKRTIKTIARLRLTRLKRRLNEITLNIAMTIMPMPSTSAA